MELRSLRVLGCFCMQNHSLARFRCARSASLLGDLSWSTCSGCPRSPSYSVPSKSGATSIRRVSWSTDRSPKSNSVCKSALSRSPLDGWFVHGPWYGTMCAASRAGVTVQPDMAQRPCVRSSWLRNPAWPRRITISRAIRSRPSSIIAGSNAAGRSVATASAGSASSNSVRVTSSAIVWLVGGRLSWGLVWGDSWACAG